MACTMVIGLVEDEALLLAVVIICMCALSWWTGREYGRHEGFTMGREHQLDIDRGIHPEPIFDWEKKQ
jgi:hypothetical protein